MSATDLNRLIVEAAEFDLPRCQNTYGVAPCTASGAAGSECYYGWITCQDKPNYNVGVYTHKFCGRGNPLPLGQLCRPYITEIDSSPTELDPENGLGRRALTTLRMIDEPDPDYELDPHVATRPAAPQGTYLSRLFARNPYYAGRGARVKRALFKPDSNGGIGYTLSDPEFVTESFIIDGVKKNRGEFILTLKDILKLADRVKVPAPTAGKLAVDLGINDLSLTLGAGQGSLYPASGYIRRGDEVIQYTANSGDVLSWADGTYRAKFGTSAAAGKTGDGVQLCQVWVAQPFSTVMKDLLNLADITDASIDTAQLVSEDNVWLGDKYKITVCLTDPDGVSALIAELCQHSGSAIWVSTAEQKVKFKVIGPRSPAEVAQKTLTDEANVRRGSVKVTTLDNLRINLAGIFYGLKSATANRREQKNYGLPPEIYIDTDARSANEYGDRRDKIEYSRFFGAANTSAMQILMSRRIAYYRDAPKDIDLEVDPQDQSIDVGDLVDLSTRYLPGVTGAPETTRCLVTKREHKGKHLALRLRTTVFARRYAFIGANSQPDYLSASSAQREYAYICNSNGKMSNGDEPYRII